MSPLQMTAESAPQTPETGGTGALRAPPQWPSESGTFHLKKAGLIARRTVERAGPKGVRRVTSRAVFSGINFAGIGTRHHDLDAADECHEHRRCSCHTKHPRIQKIDVRAQCTKGRAIGLDTVLSVDRSRSRIPLLHRLAADCADASGIAMRKRTGNAAKSCKKTIRSVYQKTVSLETMFSRLSSKIGSQVFA